MKSRLLIIAGIVCGIMVVGITFAVNTSMPRDASQFEYDKLCGTEFWTDTISKPSQSYVKSVIVQQLKERIDWDIPFENIGTYDKGDEFVVTIPGEWKGRSPVVIVVKETLENIEEISQVRTIKTVCA